MGQSRNYSQRIQDQNFLVDIRKFYKNVANVNFIKNGKITYRIYDKDGKRLTILKAIFHIYSGLEYYIIIDKKSRKLDYSFDVDGVEFTMEGKKLGDKVFCEPFNFTKNRQPYSKFKKLCSEKNLDPEEVNKFFVESIIKNYGEYMINEIKNRLPDYFGFHKNGHTIEMISKEVFMKDYKMIIETKKDESGFEIKLNRLSINYIPI